MFKFVKNPNVVFEKIDDNFFMYIPQSGKVCIANEVTFDIWDLWDGINRDEIYQQFINTYDVSCVDENVMLQVDTVLKKLLELSFINTLP